MSANKEALKVIEEEDAKGTGTVYMNGIDLVHLPTEISRLQSLEKALIFLTLLLLVCVTLMLMQAFLASNRFRRFPEPLLNLTKLRLIRLDCNFIEEIPHEVSQI